MQPTPRAVPLLVVLAVAMGTMTAGLVLLKDPCVFGGDTEALCHTDTRFLYYSQGFDRGRIPYVDPCPEGGRPCDEYPALTMIFMRAAAEGGSQRGFFFAGAAGLAALGLVAAAGIHRIAGGRRALWFAASPALMLYAFLNYDLIPVALTVLATLAFVRGRDGLAGGLLGLGAAAKLYPVLIWVAFVAERLRRGDRAGAIRVTVWAGVAGAAVYLPFLFAAPDGAAAFFEHNSSRGLNIDSLILVACDHLGGARWPDCGWPLNVVNASSFGAFAAGALAVWHAARSRDQDFPRWLFPVALLPVFLLTNKVFSPQYALWLVPWFVIWSPRLRPVLALGLSDVAVYFATFLWLRDHQTAVAAGAQSPGGWLVAALQLALLARAAILAGLVATWVRDPRGATREGVLA